MVSTYNFDNAVILLSIFIENIFPSDQPQILELNDSLPSTSGLVTEQACSGFDYI